MQSYIAIVDDSGWQVTQCKHHLCYTSTLHTHTEARSAKQSVYSLPYRLTNKSVQQCVHHSHAAETRTYASDQSWLVIRRSRARQGSMWRCGRGLKKGVLRRPSNRIKSRSSTVQKIISSGPREIPLVSSTISLYLDMAFSAHRAKWMDGNSTRGQTSWMCT